MKKGYGKLIGKSGVEESDRAADDGNDQKDQHDLDRRHFLLSHQIPADNDGDRGKKSGENFIQLILKYQISFAVRIVSSQGSRYAYPCSGNSTDNETAQCGDSFTDGHTLRADQEFNGFTTQVVACEIKVTHSEKREQVPYADEEDPDPR